ncbi:hypothetical protein PRVXT_002488 [Proteinivorax tanatarense]|uniref:Uncharacterized protein n=1 Tax=Proteinivorax tanatarense TaxID=1260629 RepID=A0AAU7VKI2_9FIRM
MEGEVIICITGESRSGKSEIANYLIKKDTIKLQNIPHERKGMRENQGMFLLI